MRDCSAPAHSIPRTASPSPSTSPAPITICAPSTRRCSGRWWWSNAHSQGGKPLSALSLAAGRHTMSLGGAFLPNPPRRERTAGASRETLKSGEKKTVSVKVDQRLLGNFVETRRRFEIRGGHYQI